MFIIKLVQEEAFMEEIQKNLITDWKHPKQTQQAKQVKCFLGQSRRTQGGRTIVQPYTTMLSTLQFFPGDPMCLLYLLNIIMNVYTTKEEA